MKKTLLATVAAAAMFAGTGLAMAEGASRDDPLFRERAGKLTH